MAVDDVLWQIVSICNSKTGFTVPGVTDRDKRLGRSTLPQSLSQSVTGKRVLSLYLLQIEINKQAGNQCLNL